MSKKKTPYDYLMDDFIEYVNKTQDPETHGMWHYTKAQLSRDVSWSLQELYARVAAATICGFDTILRATDVGLEVFFVKKIPPRPWRTF